MDPDGWEELYRRYRLMIEVRAARAGLNPADAEDVVQIVFASVAHTPPGPSPRPGAFRSWLCEQTRWRIFDKLREIGRHPSSSTSSAAPGDPHGAPASPLDTLAARDEFIRQWDAEFITHIREMAQRRIATEVTPEHLQIFQLTEEQGWPVGRVARQFQIAPATVYVIRHRIGNRLRTIAASILRNLDEEGITPPDPGEPRPPSA